MITRLSENTLIISLDTDIADDDSLHFIQRTTERLHNELGSWIIDIVPSYLTIHITFNLVQVSSATLTDRIDSIIQQQLAEPANNRTNNAKTIEIPVYYGQEVALDLAQLAQQKKLSSEQVITLHLARIYSVYAIGFAPGFAYLGYVDDTIATPRKATPRKKITAGSVGVADWQTAIYPTDSPGGWHIIGKTPYSVIDLSSESLTQFRTGDHVRFYAIDKAQFLHMGGSLS